MAEHVVGISPCTACGSQEGRSVNPRTNKPYTMCSGCHAAAFPAAARVAPRFVRYHADAPPPAPAQAQCPGVFGERCGRLFATSNFQNTRTFKRCFGCNQKASDQSNYRPCQTCNTSFYRFNIWTGQEFLNCRACTTTPVDKLG